MVEHKDFSPWQVILSMNADIFFEYNIKTGPCPLQTDLKSVVLRSLDLPEELIRHFKD